jgi:AcrR family transcriptional regulator
MAPKRASTSRKAAPKRKRRSSEEVAERILAAAEQEFEAHGYANATTATIAQRAEVTEAQIFRLYGSKQELFRAAIFQPLNRHFSEFHARQIGPLEDSISFRDMAHRYIDELQDFLEQHNGLLRSLIMASAYESGTREGVRDMEGLGAYFERGAAIMRSKVGKTAPVDPKLMVRVSFAAVLANVMFADWLFPRGIASRAAIREAIADFVIDGINANHAPRKA